MRTRLLRLRQPENILITDDELKLADFGSCRGIYSKQPYTEYISTRWYRAPECLLTDGFYNYKMDMWGVGCVFFEVLSLYPLFPGTNELDQVQKIHAILGTPPAETLAKLKKHSNSHIDFNFPHKEATPLARLIPHCSAECVDVIVKLLAYDPDDRMSARQAVKHPYFKDLRAAELKEKQAQAQAAAGSEDGISEERAHAPTTSAPRAQGRDGGGGGGKSVIGGGAGSSMLPSIDKSGLPPVGGGGLGGNMPGLGGKAKMMHGTSSSSDAQEHAPATSDGPGGGGAPSQSQSSNLPYLYDNGDEGGSGTLPPIGGFNAGVGALKIDTKSLMGSSKTQTQKAREQYRMSKQVPKKPTGLIAGAIAKAGNLSDGPSALAIGQLGVGLASQNASQSQIDAELSIKSVAKAVSHKTYQSPYSQKPRK